MELETHDLIMKFKLTDRGGAAVYDIMQPNLSHDPEGHGCPRPVDKIAEIRIRDGEVTRYEPVEILP